MTRVLDPDFDGWATIEGLPTGDNRDWPYVEAVFGLWWAIEPGIYKTRQLTQKEWDSCVTNDGINFSALVNGF